LGGAGLHLGIESSLTAKVFSISPGDGTITRKVGGHYREDSSAIV